MKKQSGSKKAQSRPGRLRIVAGKWRSRLLQIADVPGLRPTSERVRETAFNWLAPVIEGARCLDLFAGTGALGLEALSRGATEVVFVENTRRAARMIEKSVEDLEAAGAVIHHGDAIEFLRDIARGSFDIVFLDPPFAAGLLEDSCRALQESGILAPGARIYLEQDRHGPEPHLPADWTILKSKTAGNVRYSLAQAGG